MGTVQRRNFLVAAGALLGAPRAFPMDRRRVLLILAGLSAAGRVLAQPAMPRVGVLVTGSAQSSSHLVRAFVDGMTELGYRDSGNVRYLFRYGDGDNEAIRKHARELVAANVQVIWTPSSRGVAAAQRETQSLPIIFPLVADPVATGFVRSMARPGTNASGLSGINMDTMGKRIEILAETFPKIRRVGVLHDPTEASSASQVPFVQRAVSWRGMELMVVEARKREEFDGALARLAERRAEALLVVEGVLTFLHRRTLMEWAGKRRMPTINNLSDFPAAGGLMSYGPDFADGCRRSAAYVDKILKGTNVAELPVQQPTKFELVINLKTAKAIGVTIPRELLLRADRVIE